MSSPKRVAIYARVSTDRQRTDGTIESQVDSLRTFARTNGFTVIEVIRDDGVSGAIAPPERPGGRELLGLVQNKVVDIVLVQHLDRISRDSTGIHLPMFRKTLREAGVVLWTLQGEARDDTPESQLMQNMLGAIASYERLKTRERTKRGRDHAIRQGGRPRAAIPVGYRWDGATSQVVVDDAAAPYVREMFEFAAEGMSVNRIAMDLKTRGIRLGRRQGFLARTAVRDIVQRELYYTGNYQPEPNALPDVVHVVEPLVSDELWHRANQAAERRKRAPRRQVSKHGTYPYLLKGLARCVHCGRTLRAQSRDAHLRYYRCPARDKPSMNSEQCRARGSMDAMELDKLVWAQLRRLIQEPSALRDELIAAATAAAEDSVDVAAQVEQLDSELEALNQRLANLVDAVADGMLRADDVRSKRREIEEAREPLHRRRDKLASQLRNTQLDNARLAIVEERLQSLRARVDELTPEERIEIARELLDRVEVDVVARSVTLKVIALLDDESGGSGDAGGSGPISGTSAKPSSGSYGSESSATWTPMVAGGPW